ncbi:hypothetical protein [Streptomyces iconiensis]|uniref:Uncharacterized protein n=1 Tax=Streptomyces iconiensis TaxID=1384038 RepID=A0ABT6ZYI2_9ACTN|nr:hypothetical protein [Streptomyces iconiensis]MDJ1134123.1 hypothetical protein [Streptomyces iconiensis]
MSAGSQDGEGRQWEWGADEDFVVGGLPPEAMGGIRAVLRGLVDLAELRMDAGHDYDEQNPRELRTFATERLVLWYQKFEHRKRIYVVRVNWLG